MKHLTILLFAFLASVQGFAQKSQADSAYAQKDYTKAATLYEEVLQTSPSSEVYYNLGNAYYRMKDYPQAILQYERALRLDPANPDVQHNLDLCRTKIQDRFSNVPEMFFFTLTRQLRNAYGADGWGAWAIGLLAGCLLLVALFLFANKVYLRKTGFFAALACLLLSGTSQLFAWQQARRYDSEQKGVVFQNSELYASPTSTTKKLRDLHPGITVVLQDSTQASYQVQLPDGSSGWVAAKNLKKV